MITPSVLITILCLCVGIIITQLANTKPNKHGYVINWKALAYMQTILLLTILSYFIIGTSAIFVWFGILIYVKRARSAAKIRQWFNLTWI